MVKNQSDNVDKFEHEASLDVDEMLKDLQIRMSSVDGVTETETKNDRKHKISYKLVTCTPNICEAYAVRRGTRSALVPLLSFFFSLCHDFYSYSFFYNYGQNKTL